MFGRNGKFRIFAELTGAEPVCAERDILISDMEVYNFADHQSVANQYMLEMRSVDIQKDPMRFRRNLERLGQIMAYEISRRLDYEETEVTTPLASAVCQRLADKVVIATILRAGLPFHQGFLEYFDYAENAFVSAYRKYHEKGDSFDVLIEYLASPRLDGKALILVDPMLATGTSMDLAYRALQSKGKPGHIFMAAAIASQQAIDYLKLHFPDNASLWVGAIDPGINEHSYIVPGLGDAGDLAYGIKD